MADLWHQVLQHLQKLNKRQKYILAGTALLLLAVIVAGSYWWGSRPDYVPLFTNMEASDAGAVAQKLKEMKVPYEVGANGTAILVPSKDVYRIRLELASQGLPRGQKGFEIFDQTKFGTTEFQNKVYYLEALQGELARTIEQLDGVEKARVHIVLPTDSLYKKNEKPATASIMLKLKPGAQLSREQVQGIVNLAANSVQGLKPENITVVDNYAHVLNDQADSSYAAGGALTQLELTRKFQDSMQKSIQSMLEQVLGPGRVAVRVNADLNFDKRVVDSKTFTPVIDDQGIMRSQQKLQESFQGTSPGPGGPPGTVANIPGYVTSTNTQSNYDKKETTTNWEVNETDAKTEAAPGSVRRLTVAVMVDANLTNVQQASIINAVSSAVGLNPARGDAISVETVPFSTELQDQQRQAEQVLARQSAIKLGLIIASIAAALGVLLYMVRRAARRRRAAENEEAAALAPAEMVVTPKTPEVSPQDLEKMKQREAIEKFAKTKPDDVAQLIKAWLSEE